ncbi:metallophosphoesterase [Thalassotalea crassostreae]|uniref:metallophosphoesterase n=1 Tax=Thalassotalea crassostreae TaxID=1763536 RepID=UPI0008386F93|nr:metallophosphoesterase [Thalassotalea crassostreae]
MIKLPHKIINTSLVLAFSLLTFNAYSVSNSDSNNSNDKSKTDRRGGRTAPTEVDFPKINLGPKPALAKVFEPFADKVNIAWDENYLYVEADSMADHQMMVGITAWNRQVPIPQPYKGGNAWRIPLDPKIAETAISAKNTLFKGSIAVAANGIPIFNPIKQDGRTDTFLNGELDEFGGHAGRADDYHYHITPWHLEKTVGKGVPVAVALDGFPIHTSIEPDGKPAKEVDWLNGHTYPNGLVSNRVHFHENGDSGHEKSSDEEYHYHGSKSYPYLNGGFKGTVALEGGEVKVQPRAQSIRPYTRPLRGAEITDFKRQGNKYQLTYSYNDTIRHIEYTDNEDGTFTFKFDDGDGVLREEKYQRRLRGSQQKNKQRKNKPGKNKKTQHNEPQDGQRKPWVVAHLTELDQDKNGVVSRKEMLSEAEATFAGYDLDGSGYIETEESKSARVRQAMAGFVRGHFEEIDIDVDQKISRNELVGLAIKMFEKSNGQGRKDKDKKNKKTKKNKKVKGSKGGGSSQTQSAAAMQEILSSPMAAEQAYDIILGRPSDENVTARILPKSDGSGHIIFGPEEANLQVRTKTINFIAGNPFDIVINKLQADTRYYYRFVHNGTLSEQTYSFHTARAPSKAFSFTVQSDSHLDSGTKADVYASTLANIRAKRPDFHMALGDTFMVDKYDDYRDSKAQYLAQRYFLGSVSHSSPLFFVLGNHDGESGRWDDGTADNMAVWSAKMRKRYFPNPYPNDFYSGNTTEHPYAGQLENYYSWQWGDALFVTLDPFWFTSDQGRRDMWSRSLGKQQYDWLKKTLRESQAKYKFIFIHHLVGGLDKSARGGREAAQYFEWGGDSLNGDNEFKKHRPDWEKPIHDLLVENKVTMVFHGHDHLYVKQELDGIIYQEVPQPGHGGRGNTRSALEYGYKSGKLLGSSGHVQINVSEDEVKVDYVKSSGDIAHSYYIAGSKEVL